MILDDASANALWRDAIGEAHGKGRVHPTEYDRVKVRSIYAAGYAAGQGQVSAIPPCPHGNRGNCRTCELERATAPPHAGQEPDDERSESARSDALVQRLRFIGGGTTTEAADRIEADAARIAELDVPSRRAVVRRAETAEAALAQAEALLRRTMDDIPGPLWNEVHAFLASAKADERSDGQASREGAK